MTNPSATLDRRAIHSFICGAILLVLTGSVYCQQNREELVARAREHARILASREYEGRGYQNDGHLKAAKYIASVFREIGVRPVKPELTGDSAFFQSFSFALNRIDSATLKVNGQNLRIGRDYIVNSRSGGYKAEGRPVDVEYGLPFNFEKNKKIRRKGIAVMRSGLPPKVAKKEDLKEKYAAFKNDASKIDLAARADLGAVVFLREKLTASLSGIPVEIPVIDVKESAWPSKKIKSMELEIHREFKKVYTQNVVGLVEGKKYPDRFIIVSAHYDHLGRMGDAIFTGANDNASGTAMMLTMAEYFAQPGNQPDYSMAFVGFGAEEAGLVGSRHWVEQEPLVPLENTRFVMNMDLMGNGDEGITVVAGLDFEPEFDVLKEINTQQEWVTKIKGRRNAPNSDHFFFVTQDIKAFFIYTLGGPPHYHDINDTYKELRFSKYYEVQQLIIQYLEKIQKMGI